MRIEVPHSADSWDKTIDEAIAVCDGDARAAIKALLIAHAYLEDELATAAVGYGFSKGWHARRR